MMSPWVNVGGTLISFCATGAGPDLISFADAHALKKRAEILDSSDKTGKKSEIQRAIFVWEKSQT
jgi:hypothetical protein